MAMTPGYGGTAGMVETKAVGHIHVEPFESWGIEGGSEMELVDTDATLVKPLASCKERDCLSVL